MAKKVDDMTNLELAVALPGAAMRKVFALRRTQPSDKVSTTGLMRRFYNMLPSRNNVHVDEVSAFALDTVFACVRLLRKSLAASDWDLFELDPQTGNRQPIDHRIWWMLNRRPNAEMTGAQFKKYWITGALLGRGGLAEIERNRAGDPIALWPIETGRWYRERENGVIQFRVTDCNGPDVILNQRDVLYLPPDSLDAERPIPLIEWARSAIATSISTNEFAETYFANAGVLSMVLETDDEVDPETIEKVTSSFIETYTGRGKWHGIAALTHGLKVKPIGPKAEEAMLLDVKKHLVTVVCRYFGVPPHLVFDLERSTNNNIEHQGLDFIRYGLSGWCEEIAGEVSTKLFPDDPFAECRVQIEWLAEGDSKARTEEDRTAISTGQMSINEVNRKRGRNSIGRDGDHRYMQQAFTTIDRVNDGETLKGGDKSVDPEPNDGTGEGDLER